MDLWRQYTSSSVLLLAWINYSCAHIIVIIFMYIKFCLKIVFWARTCAAQENYSSYSAVIRWLLPQIINIILFAVCFQMVWLFHNIAFTLRMGEACGKLKEEFLMYFDHGVMDCIPTYLQEGGRALLVDFIFVNLITKESQFKLIFLILKRFQFPGLFIWLLQYQIWVTISLNKCTNNLLWKK